ncbi:hypothetical protein [Rubellicoccus peritrichatus]|uniref:Trimeric autotransporter adhesin YadA-like head domain-containing protein n=1 Tax=Rubellicoccus peritrichatus TaxID=3080537 RepID=A0AAQ3QV99_9BACT|nr:hypothetical protein [Puniceicoccus sp. CR14]WOO41343.1 hypothetical protein RZN69_22215 [Puniceicoccus sp. CR14]
MHNQDLKQKIKNTKADLAMNTYRKYIAFSLITAAFITPASYAETLTVEGDLEVTAAGTAEGDLTVENELTVGEDTTVTSPAVKTDFKVESNGVIWAGEGAGFDDTNLIPTGTGSRMIWVPSKNALRAGEATNTIWDEANIGDHSVAFGSGKASGIYSFAFGGVTLSPSLGSAFYSSEATGDYSFAASGGNASGDYSFAFGSEPNSPLFSTAQGNHSIAMGAGGQANGNHSIAIGNYAQANGDHSISLGVSTVAGAWNSIAIGNSARSWYRSSTAFGVNNILGVVENSWRDSDPLFEIGNGGTSGINYSNALTVLKDGRMALGTHSSIAALQTQEETVQIQGPVLLGDYAGGTVPATPTAGAIRYNATENDFIGYDGTDWKSLTDPGTVTSATQLVDSQGNTVVSIDGNGDLTFDANSTVTFDGAVVSTGGLTTDALQVGASEAIDEATATSLIDLSELLPSPDATAQDWIKNFYTDDSIVVYVLDIDDYGNRYVTGYYRGGFSIGNDIDFQSASSTDYEVFLMKFDSSGDLLWTRSIVNDGSSTGVVVDNSSGSVYVTGSFYDTLEIVSGEVHTSAGSADTYVAGFDSNTGNPLWANTYGGVGSDSGGQIAVDGNGSVFVTGRFIDPLQIVSGETLTSNGSADFWIAGFSGSTGTPLWANSYGGSGNDIINGITANSSSSVYVTGSFWNSIEVVSGNTLTSAGYGDVLVAGFNGVTGAPLWANAYGNNSNGGDSGGEIAVDSANGSLIVTGSFRDSIEIVSGNTLNSNGGNDFFIAAFDDATGNSLWAGSYGGSSGDGVGKIALDGHGSFITAGTFGDSMELISGEILNSMGSTDIFVAAFSTTNGTPLWAKSFGSSSNDSVHGFSAAPDGSLTLSLRVSSATTFGSQIAFADALYTFAPDWLNTYAPVSPVQNTLNVYRSKAIGEHSIALGDHVIAEGDSSIAWGNGNVALGNNSTAWGNQNNAEGDSTSVWGSDNFARGDYSTVWGGENIASGANSTAWGRGNIASGDYSTVWGDSAFAANEAIGHSSTAWGALTKAIGDYSTAWGIFAQATGSYSTVWGFHSRAESYVSTALGHYNVGGFDAANNGNTTWIDYDPLFEIGNGTGNSARANAVTVLKNGQTTLQNKHWFASVDVDSDGVIDSGADLTAVPADPDGATAQDESSAGEALVVNGHTRLVGNVDISGIVTIQPQGDLSMGDFGGSGL